MTAPGGGTGFLARTNPLAHLAATFVLIVPVLLSFDPFTPLVFLGYSLVVILGLGRVGLWRFLRTMAPLLLLPLGLLVLNLFFSENPGQTPLFEILFLEVTPHSAYRAGVLAGRSLALIVLSVGYLLVTDPLDLVNSLMQQAKLSPRIGFSIYVAWNAIPSLRQNLDRIQKVHRVRLRSKRRSLREALATPVSLLAGAIRHAQRAALSMHARGLDAVEHRTFLKTSVWRRRDTVYLVVMVAIAAATMYALVGGGLFVFGLG